MTAPCFSCGKARENEPIINPENGRGAWYCRKCCVWPLAHVALTGPAQGELFGDADRTVATSGRR